MGFRPCHSHVDTHTGVPWTPGWAARSLPSPLVRTRNTACLADSSLSPQDLPVLMRALFSMTQLSPNPQGLKRPPRRPLQVRDQQTQKDRQRAQVSCDSGSLAWAAPLESSLVLLNEQRGGQRLLVKSISSPSS